MTGRMIHNSSVNGEALLASYSWCHDEWLVQIPQPINFLGHVVS